MLRRSVNRWARRRRGRGLLPGRASLAAHRTLVLLVPLLAVALLTSTACVANATGPARTTGTYAHKAAATAAAASSHAATVGLAARAGADGDATFPYLSVLAADAEDAFVATRTTFDSIQPPDVEAEAIRDELDALLDTARDDITDARVAIRRGDREPLASLAGRLELDAEALSSFEEAHR